MIKGIQTNFSLMNKGDLLCPMNCFDISPLDTQSHLLNCSTLKDKLSSEESIGAKKVKYNHIYGSVEEQRGVILVLARLLDIRKEMLEEREDHLPVG